MTSAQLEIMIALLEADIELENHMIQQNEAELEAHEINSPRNNDWERAYLKGSISARKRSAKTLEMRIKLLKSWRGVEQDAKIPTAL